MFNPGEEIGSPGSGEAIAELGAEHDVALSFEPSPAKAIIEHEGVLLSAAGTAQTRIRVEGRSAEAGGDVRISAPDASERLLAALEAKVVESKLVPDTTTTVTLEPMRPMYVAGEKGKALAELAEGIYAELDGRRLLMHPTTNGGTDAGFAGRSGHRAVLEGLGLAGWGYHAANEFIEFDSIVPRLYLAARMLVELGEQAGTSSR